jgi:hypothetical protein
MDSVSVLPQATYYICNLDHEMQVRNQFPLTTNSLSLLWLSELLNLLGLVAVCSVHRTEEGVA